MAYTPTEWSKGDIITAEKLNKLENGVVSAGGGGSESFVVFYTIDFDDQTQTGVLTCDKTPEEVETAKADGKAIDARLIYYNTNNGWYTPVKVLYHQMLEFTYSFDFVVIDPTYNGLSYVQIWLDALSQPMKWEFTDSAFTLTPYAPTGDS